jgi:Rrf2 family transcriptional regulator, cysteine metabolism repressor
MRLSRTTVYAIHATLHLAQATPGVRISGRRLAREGNMPERFLLQILRTLVKRGVLKSTCGAAGGYLLSRSPQQITLRDIVLAFDNPLEKTIPLLKSMPLTARCKIADRLRAGASAAAAELQKMTVADLLCDVTVPRTATSLGVTPPNEECVSSDCSQAAFGSTNGAPAIR